MRAWRGSSAMGVRALGHVLVLKRLDRTRLYFSERNAKAGMRWGRVALVLRVDRGPYQCPQDVAEAIEADVIDGAGRALLRLVRDHA